MRASRGLKWENKMNKPKRSILFLRTTLNSLSSPALFSSIRCDKFAHFQHRFVNIVSLFKFQDFPIEREI